MKNEIRNKELFDFINQLPQQEPEIDDFERGRGKFNEKQIAYFIDLVDPDKNIAKFNPDFMIGVRGARVLGKVLTNPNCQLKELIIVDNENLHLAIEDIAEGLEHNKTVNSIHFNECWLRCEDAIKLFNALMKNTSVKHIFIYGINHIGYANGDLGLAIANALKKNLLEEILIECESDPESKISDIDAAHIFNALISNTSLRRVEFDFGVEKEDDMVISMKSLEKLSQSKEAYLKTLILQMSDLKLEKETFRELAKAMRNGCGLDLQFNIEFKDDASFQDLARVLEYAPFTKINLFNPISTTQNQDGWDVDEYNRKSMLLVNSLKHNYVVLEAKFYLLGYYNYEQTDDQQDPIKQKLNQQATLINQELTKIIKRNRSLNLLTSQDSISKGKELSQLRSNIIVKLQEGITEEQVEILDRKLTIANCAMDALLANILQKKEDIATQDISIPDLFLIAKKPQAHDKNGRIFLSEEMIKPAILEMTITKILMENNTIHFPIDVAISDKEKEIIAKTIYKFFDDKTKKATGKITKVSSEFSSQIETDIPRSIPNSPRASNKSNFVRGGANLFG